MPTQLHVFRIRVTESSRVKINLLHPGQDGWLELPDEPLEMGDITLERLLHLANLVVSNEAVQVDMVELGEGLFKGLFSGALRRVFVEQYEQLADAQLRIEIEIDEKSRPDLAALPWEFLRIPMDGRYGSGIGWLATDPHLSLTRRRPHWTPAAKFQLQQGEKIRIGVLVAAPTDLGPVKFQEVRDALIDIAQVHSRHMDLLPITNPATRQAIDELLTHKPQIIHFMGHARFGNDIGQISLVNAANTADWIDGADLVEITKRFRPQIVILQACESGASSASAAFVGVASQMVEQGVPLVVAMQYEVTNSVAKQFALEFYRQLFSLPVDLALQESRRKIALRPGRTPRDFATPIVHMRQANVHLIPQIMRESTTSTKSLAVTEVLSGARKRHLDMLLIDLDNAYQNLEMVNDEVERGRIRRRIQALEQEINETDPLQN